MPKSIREALDDKRHERKGTVTSLILCKQELFYLPQPIMRDSDDTVYPVSLEIAKKEGSI